MFPSTGWPGGNAEHKNQQAEGAVETGKAAGGDSEEPKGGDLGGGADTQPPVIDCVEYSKILIKIRAQKKWIPEKLAEKIGVSLNMLSAIEDGRCEPSLDTIYKIKSLMAEIRLYENYCKTPEEYGYDLLSYLVRLGEDDPDLAKEMKIAWGRVNPLFWDNLKERHIKYGDISFLRKMLERYGFDEGRFFAFCAVNPILVIDDNWGQEKLTVKLYNDLLRLEVDNCEWKAGEDADQDNSGSTGGAPNTAILSVLERSVSLAETQRVDNREMMDNLLVRVRQDKDDLKKEKDRLLAIVESQQRTIESQQEHIRDISAKNGGKESPSGTSDSNISGNREVVEVT